MNIGRQKYLLAMTFVLLLAFAFGAYGLNMDVIWLDELYSVSNLGAFDGPYSPVQIIDSLAEHSPAHVPLFFILGAGWAQLAGWSQFSLRLISLFCGVLMVAWLYRFAADAVNRRTAAVAALLTSTSAFVILHFHEIRMYTLFMWLAVMHSWLYWRLAHGFRVTRLTWLLFILTADLLFYTHNSAMVLFVGLGIYHLVFLARSKRWFNIILGWGVGALLFLPYIPNVIGGLSYKSNNSKTVPAADLVEAFSQLLVNGLDILWLLLILLFGYALWRRRPRAISGLLTITLTMILALLFADWQFGLIQLDQMRYFLVVWWTAVILFAWGLTSPPRWFAITALFISLWCIAGFRYGQSAEILDYAGTVDRGRQFPPLHEYVFHLKGVPRPQDYLVGFSGASERVNKVRHQKGSIADYYLKSQLGIDGVFLETHLMRYRLERDMRRALDDYAYILFAYNPESTPRNAVTALGIIREEFVPCAVIVDKPNLLVQRYVNPILDCEREEYAPLAYDNGIRVVDRFARYASESEVLQILTGWEVPNGQMLEEYNVSMQILNPDWRNVRQTDRHLYDNLLPWNVIELSTKGLPAGDYRLMMILYHRDSGEKVEGVDLATGEAGKILPILTFTIGS